MSTREDKYRQALSAVIGITMESLEGGSMSSKERKAKAILKLLEDMKWPLLNPFTGELLHGGLKSEGSPRGPLQSDEVYIGRYSPLADAIRDWQGTKEEA